MRFSYFVIGIFIPTILAQTYSDCNPYENPSCPPNRALSSGSHTIDFTSPSPDLSEWTSIGSGSINFTNSSSGAQFIIAEQGDAPTLQSDWYIFFGKLEVHLKTAEGRGIVSSLVLLSDVLDEIDWEFIGSSPTFLQTNFFLSTNTSNYLNSNTTTLPFSTNATDHNYTIHWTRESCIWYLDTHQIHILRSSSSSTDSSSQEDSDSDSDETHKKTPTIRQDYPQTPMRIKIGPWAGGDPNNQDGTIEWAGGVTDYDQGPFTMIVEKIVVENENPAKEYIYSDEGGKTGWEAIRIVQE